MMKVNLYLLVSLFISFIFYGICIAEEISKETEIVGKKEFMNYCGSCHGSNGKGNGPIVHFIKRKPADLTQLSKNNNGVFPFERIWGVFDGTYAFSEHGTSEMPVWGYQFIKEAKEGGKPSSIAKAKALDIVLYLQVIQE